MILSILFGGILLLLASLLCIGKNGVELGDFYFQKAHSFVQQNNLPLAMAYFRSACRHLNSSALYWNDLGVTEMRMGQYLKARRRFAVSLSIDPYFAAAQDNMRDITKYLKGAGDRNLETMEFMTNKKRFRYRHGVLPLLEYNRSFFLSLLAGDPTNLESTDRVQNHIRLLMSQPFVVRGIFNPLDDEINQYFDLRSLSRRFGDTRVDYYPQNMLEESSHPFFFPLARALDQLSAPEEVFTEVDVSLPGTYLQLNLNASMFKQILQESHLHTILPTIFDDENWWSRRCLGKRKIKNGENGEQLDSEGDPDLLSRFYLRHHWKMLLIGSSEAGMFAHQDILRTASYQLQISGEKRWHLCPGNQSRWLYKPGDVDLFQPNYARYPLVKQAQCREVIATPGDLVFYPGDYWHQTLNLQTPSVALSGTVVTHADHDQLRGHLEMLCDAEDAYKGNDEETLHLEIERRVCHRLRTYCFDRWREMFSDGNDNIDRVAKGVNALEDWTTSSREL